MPPTPFGELSTLDPENPETQQRILFHDKHQVLEGIVAENHIDQVLDRALSEAKRLQRLNVVSVMASWSGSNRRMVLVLDQGTPADLLQPYLVQLAKTFFAKLVRYDPERRQFLTHKDNYREGIIPDEPLEKLTEALGVGQITPVAANVKDPTRQQQSFWGQIAGAYGKRLGREVVLPRIFKNFAIQPYFNRGVWDLDRIYWDSARHTYGVIEVKHKYLFGTGTLQFGINCGSCGVLRDLSAAGFLCFHSVMVKPFWNDKESVTYLFNNLEARSRVLFCGKHFTLPELEQLYRQRSRRSPSKTTLTGQGGLDYVSFEASALRRIGKLNDQGLSEQFAAALGGALPSHVTDRELRDLRLENR